MFLSVHFSLFDTTTPVPSQQLSSGWLVIRSVVVPGEYVGGPAQTSDGEQSAPAPDEYHQQGVAVAPINASRQQPVRYVKIRHASHSIRNVHQCSDRALF
jgi:hypothetical protein